MVLIMIIDQVGDDDHGQVGQVAQVGQVDKVGQVDQVGQPIRFRKALCNQVERGAQASTCLPSP